MSYHVVTTYDDDPEGRLRPTDHHVQRDEDGFTEATPPFPRDDDDEKQEEAETEGWTK